MADGRHVADAVLLAEAHRVFDSLLREVLAWRLGRPQDMPPEPAAREMPPGTGTAEADCRRTLPSASPSCSPAR
jgi:hypothetical protein